MPILLPLQNYVASLCIPKLVTSVKFDFLNLCGHNSQSFNILDCTRCNQVLTQSHCLPIGRTDGCSDSHRTLRDVEWSMFWFMFNGDYLDGSQKNTLISHKSKMQKVMLCRNPTGNLNLGILYLRIITHGSCTKQCHRNFLCVLVKQCQTKHYIILANCTCAWHLPR